MKMTKKEKYLIGILGTVLITVGYYQFVYKAQIEKLDALKNEQAEKEADYNNKMATIRTIDERNGKIKGLGQLISEQSGIFYPEIIQENLILEIDKLLADSGLNGSFSFTEKTVGLVELMTDGINPVYSTTFDSIVDEYNNTFKEEIAAAESNTEVEGEVSTEVNAGTDEIVTEEIQPEVEGNENSEEVYNNDNTIGNYDATAEQIKVSLNFTGSYLSLKEFIRLVNNNERKIVITNISLSGQGEGENITGSMNLEFYGIPKLGNVDSEYYDWLLENSYGKSYPFSTALANGTTIEELANSEKPYDFVMLVKPVASDLPAVMLGKANDKENTSYLYSDNTAIENVEIIVTEKDKKFYYKYKVGGTQYPSDYSGYGVEFTPLADDIALNIFSIGRLGDQDTSGVNIILKNDTTKTINVTIESEDVNKPRVALTSEGSEVKIIKK